MDAIQVRGARQHNLQNVSVAIPRNRLTVITGLSGSGKSTLAFDTIYAEGQRRYVETLSPYARQFLDQLERPRVDSIDGLSPALSIDQKTASRSRRSTVGTVTEVYDYLRLLFSAVAVPHCTKCGVPIQKQHVDEISKRTLDVHGGELITVLAPVVRGRKGSYLRQLKDYYARGFLTARVDGQLERLETLLVKGGLKRTVEHTIEIVVDRVYVRQDSLDRLKDSIRTAAKLANGLVLVVGGEAGQRESLFSERLACARCGENQRDLEPRSFSFNSRHGACGTCKGLGLAWQVDARRLIRHPDRPLTDGNWPQTQLWAGVLHQARPFAKQARVDLTKAWNRLTAPKREWLLYGAKGKLPKGSPLRKIRFRGLVPLAERLLGVGPGYQPNKVVRQYMASLPCRECGGKRLRPESLAARVSDHTIAELAAAPLSKLARDLESLGVSGAKREVAERIREEIRERVAFLCQIGLDHLSLDRPSSSLSGGEAQRVRLATQIGTRLQGVLYVLDEPSIGLHARDHGVLLDALGQLRDLGNTVIVVEHDQATIERADHVIDLGPGAGRLGGELVAEGSAARIASVEESLTGAYLSGRKSAWIRPNKYPPIQRKLVVRGASQHNLKDIDVAFPLGNLCVVTGVSGSGKSTLVNHILHPALAEHFGMQGPSAGTHDRIDGMQHVEGVLRIDQSPIGRTPRSNPATYTGVFTPIRGFYSQLAEARARGYAPGRFSFNVRGGRCDNCDGAGSKRIEMKFLPDVFVTCEVCKGLRYKHETLEVRYKGHSIADLLGATVEEALELMSNLPVVSRKLNTLLDVGLGYIQLGQPSTTISGGEAQRMKLARELSKRKTSGTVYVLDEPTTGLHFEDVHKLLSVLRRLVDQGSTVIVIEHQMDVIRSADWVVDLGPESGEGGGRVVCTGRPHEIARHPSSHTGRALRETGVR
ncbi:MAG: excinuclease ABC subunit UvrA [Bryobacterales bacterium]|nr:excinuclease ABC subunit UvrA [Bryobacterales bacterium]